MRDSLGINAMAGGAAGITVDAILFPLDTIKTRLQARKQPGVQVQSGFKGSYRGLLAALLNGFPGAATFWTAYEGTKQMLLPVVAGTSYAFLAHAGAAVTAEVAVCAVRTPLEIVKQQMQTGMHSGVATALRTIIQTEGLRGLYAGAFATIFRDIPFDIIQFCLYEEMKQRLQKHRQRDLVLWENAVLGSIAGACAAASTTPLDVVKTRLMTQASMPRADRYTGVLDALARIHAEEGAGALFAGVKPRVMWIGIGGAIFIGSFEEFRRRLSLGDQPPGPEAIIGSESSSM